MNTYKSNVVYGDGTTEQVIILRNDTFSKLMQEQVVLNNFELNLGKNQQVTFPSYNKIITLQNVKLTSNSYNVSFTFNGQKNVVLKNINIDGLTFTGENTLFIFKDCDSVLIDTFNLKNSVFGGTNYTLFSFTNIQNLEIINLNIINHSFTAESKAENIILISNANQFKFSSSLFQDIESLGINKLFIKSYGILTCIMDQIHVEGINGISFFNSDNYFTLDDQTVYLYSDQTKLTAVTFLDVTNISKSLITFNGNLFHVINSNFTTINCATCFGASLNVIKTKQFLLQDSYFMLNYGNEGGAIAFIDCQYQQLQILGTTFKNCTALAHGGAIFSSSSDIMLNNTVIQYCQAEIGGGIRYTELEPLFIYYNQQYEKTKQPKYYLSNQINNNQAKIYGQNIGSYPKTISIKSKNSLNHEKYRILAETDQYNLDLYSLSNFQSSAEISFEFQILDQELNPIFFDITSFEKNKYPDIISNEITQFNIKSTPGTDDVKIFGQYITDYFQFNQTSQTFSINQMMVIANPSTSNHIFFETPSIKKVLNPTEASRQFSDGPFHIRLNIQFRECIRGEVYKLSGSIFYCQECKEGSYSIVAPIKEEYETQLCLRCPDEASYCYRDQMTLYPGYWKRGNTTDQIVYCTNKPENCEGTEDQGYCIEGHIGALCENCDVYGKVWPGEFQSDGKFNCIDCTKLRKASYVLPTLFIALGIIVYILISIRIALSISKLIVIGYYLRKLNLLAINKSSYQDTTNMNLKAMMHYMQISSMINTFVIQLPEWMTFIPDYLGSPVENMLYTFDCYLNKASQSKYPIIFLRTVWFLAIPVLYLAVVGIFYWLMVILKMAKYDKSYIISGLVFLCFFTQPNMVSNLLGVMSCRKIDDKYYIQSDISFECYTDIHLQYIGIVCFPGLILWGAVIPFFILRTLIKNKQNLDHASIRLKYGFLYQDYKNKHFYWEFVKIYTKLFVIAILSFYGDPYTNKLVIILILFLIYQVALIKFQPYQMKYFQSIDKTSMIVFIILLIMNIFLYNKPDEVQQQIFYVILIMISNGYQFLLLLEVLKAKFQIRFRDTYNKIVMFIHKVFPFMKRFLSINKRIPMKTFRYWMKVKFFLNECSERKQYNENSSPQFGRSSEQINPEQKFFQPSKRNRIRMFNQNLQLSNSKNNCNIESDLQQYNIQFNFQQIQVMSPENMIFSEEISYRNGQQIAKLMKENQPLSVERSDSNFNQLLSPKMFGSFSHMSDKNVLEQRRDDFILEFDDPATAQQFKRVTYGQLLRSLFNYADVEEEEDERRYQKKASVHHEYRLYQKTDLIQKNLKPVEMDDSKTPILQIPVNDENNPDIDDSIHDMNDDRKVKRHAKNLAPRFILSQENLDSSTKNETSSKKEPFSDNQNEVQEVSESSQENLQLQPKARHVYLQQDQNLFVKEIDNRNNQADNKNNNDQLIDLFQDNDDLLLSPEDLEEDEDHRRLQKKAAFQHDANIQRKANLIYKNLVFITYDPSLVEEQNEDSAKEELKQQPEIQSNKDQLCDIEDSLLSLEDNDQRQNIIPENKEFGGLEKINTLSPKSKEDVIQEIELVQQLPLQVSPKQSPKNVPSQNDISASKQIQDIINTRAEHLMNRGQTLEGSTFLADIRNQSNSNANSTELNHFVRQQTVNQQKHTPEQNKIVNQQVFDIIEEDENINIDDDQESEATGKDTLTENNTKKVKSYFNNSPTNQNKDLEQSQQIQSQKQIKKVDFTEPYSTPGKKQDQMIEDKYSAFDDHNDEKTLFQEHDFNKQLTLTGVGNYFENMDNQSNQTPSNNYNIKDYSESEEQSALPDQTNE